MPQVQMVGDPAASQKKKANPFGDFSKQPSQVEPRQASNFDSLFGGQAEEVKQGWAGKRNPFN